MSKGTKNDKGKPDLSLIPKDAMWGMGRALTFGASKYGRDNFRQGIEYSRLSAACMRHLTAFLEGEDNDPESGYNHIDHALASLAMLRFMIEHKADMDDRWKPEEDEHKKHVDAHARISNMTDSELKKIIDVHLEVAKEIRKVENGY